jgi:hypothetical protein
MSVCCVAETSRPKAARSLSAAAAKPRVDGAGDVDGDLHDGIGDGLLDRGNHRSGVDVVTELCGESLDGCGLRGDLGGQAVEDRPGVGLARALVAPGAVLHEAANLLELVRLLGRHVVLLGTGGRSGAGAGGAALNPRVERPAWAGRREAVAVPLDLGTGTGLAQ